MRPARSRTRVFGPTKACTSAVEPTATIRLPRTATRLRARPLRVDRVDDGVLQDEVGRLPRRRCRAERPQSRGQGEAQGGTAGHLRTLLRRWRRSISSRGETSPAWGVRLASSSPTTAEPRHRPPRGARSRSGGSTAAAVPARCRGPFTRPRHCARRSVGTSSSTATRVRATAFSSASTTSGRGRRSLGRGGPGRVARGARPCARSSTAEDGRPPLGPAHVFPAAVQRVGREPRSSTAGCGPSPARTGCRRSSDWTGRPVRLAERAMPGAKPATRLGGHGRRGRPDARRPRRAAPAAGRTPVASASSFSPGRWTRSRTTAAATSASRSTRASAARPACARPTTPTPGGPASGPRGPTSRRVLDLTRAPAAVRRAARLEGWILGRRAGARPRGVSPWRPEERAAGGSPTS